MSQYDGDLSIETLPELSDSSLELVKKGGLDFYFDYKLPDHSKLDYREIAQEHIVVIARQHHPDFTRGMSKDAYIKADHILLNFPHPEHSLLDVLMHRSKRVNRKVKARVRQYVAIPSLVVQSDCIATVPKGMADYFAARYPLSVFDFPFPIAPITAYMIWHQSKNHDPAHVWLRNVILDLVNQR